MQGVVARWRMVIHMAGMHRSHVFLMTAGNWSGWRRRWRVCGHRCYLRLRSGVGGIVVRNWWPPLPEACGITHARNERHDVVDARRMDRIRHESVGIAC
jgi:hypothetical protein